MAHAPVAPTTTPPLTPAFMDPRALIAWEAGDHHAPVASSSAATPYLHLDQLDLGDAGDRFAHNLAALRLLHDLTTTGRTATAEEQRTLARFSAFGDSRLLSRLTTFDGATRRYAVAAPYRSFLDDTALRSLRRAARTAFYTPYDVITTIWQALLARDLAEIAAPRILEPACGVGAFLTAMPPALRARAHITAVELDTVAAQITAQLHPDITLHAGVGYETVALADNSIDLAISNVPFGAIPVVDRELPPVWTKTIHDYFFGKTLRVVRPGGLVVFVTSWGTLDKGSATVRRRLHEAAELLGAFRLPSGVFAATSGSTSGADLVIVRKRPVPLLPGQDEPAWIATAPADYRRIAGGQHLTHGSRYTSPEADPDRRAVQRLAVNTHWLDQPATVIGTPRVIDQDDSLWLQVQAPVEGIAEALGTALSRSLPARLFGDPDATPATAPASPPRATPPQSLDAAIAQLDARHRPQLEALATIYTTAKQLLAAELTDADAGTIADLRADLNRHYDRFVARWGALSHPRITARLRQVPELRFLQALETDPQPGTADRWRARKAAIFQTRTVRPQQAVLPGTLSVDEALAWCLNERGAADLGRIAYLAGSTPDAVEAALGDRIFHDPRTGRWTTADAYLSGDVRVKRDQAARAAAHDARYTRNVAALDAVQPAPLGPAAIIVTPAAVWLPDDVVTAFVEHLLPAFSGTVRFNHALGAWVLTDTNQHGARSVEASSKWGTARTNAIAILDATFANMPIMVYDEIRVRGSKRRVFNATETVAAQDKQAAIRTAFTEWLWTDAARAERLCQIYNTRFNSVVLRTYDGSHLQLPGMNTALLRAGDLDPYQKAGVWQMVQNPATLLAFDTGGGKTWTACAGVMESIRLGLASKALIVVPNNLVGQWADALQALYPAANILALPPEEFDPHRRGVALSRIATGNWQAVIIGQTSLKALPIDAGTIRTFRDEETDQLRTYLEELRYTAISRDEKRSFKQIETAVDRFEARLDGLEQGIRRDSTRTIAWDELGIDMIVIDEAQDFKNLWVPSRLNVPGVPRAGSQRALDLRIKTWALLRRRAKVVFLTATPVMNTIGEVYIMQRYLQQEVLQSAGIHHFDAWASLFGEIAAAFEMKPDGSGFRMHTRLRAFVNVPDLGAMWRQCLNVRSKAEMQLPEPVLVTGKPIPVAVPPSPALRAYVQTLAARADAIRGGRVKPDDDNMLSVTGDGRKAALDLRLVLPGIPRQPHSKITALADRVAALSTTFAPLRATQLVFCDLATPKGRGPEPAAAVADTAATESESQAVETAAERQLSNFVYHEIRDELVRRGIPRAEIAFIHDYDQPAQKKALFAALNDGRVRVLLGSTAKMSTGMNVQERLIALHHLDCPWRPGDLHQRDGRIQRQGNVWPEVYVFRYITEGSFDGYSWQTIETKARFIEQIMSGTLHQRRIADVSEFVLSAAEVKAIASGNPRVLRKVELELKLSRMERVRAVHHETVAALHRRHAGLAWEHAQEQQTIAHLHAALAVIDRTGPFSVRLRATPDATTEVAYDRLAAADAALRALLRQLMARLTPRSPGIEQVLGTYRGTVVQGEAHPRWGFNAVLLVNGQRLFPLFSAEDTSPFRSAEARLRQLAQRITTSEHRQAEIAGQQAEIMAELDRLAVWDGQAAYDAAEAELTAINVEFAALEEATTTTTTAPAPAAAPAAAPTVPTLQLVRDLAALHPDAGTIVPAALITYPAAPDALAFMAREQARTTAAISVTVVPVPAASAAATTHPTPITVVTVVPPSRKGQPVSTAVEQFAWDF